jgi:hypothetical protein
MVGQVVEVVRMEQRPARRRVTALHMAAVVAAGRRVVRTEPRQVAVRHTVVEQQETRTELAGLAVEGSSRLAAGDTVEVVVVVEEGIGQEEVVGSSPGCSPALYFTLASAQRKP